MYVALACVMRICIFRRESRDAQMNQEFSCKDGRGVLLRPPSIDDAGGLVELNNSVLNEDLDIDKRPFLNIMEATAMLHDLLKRISKGELLACLALVDSRIVALATVIKLSGCSSHVGEFGVGVMKGYRGIGVGKLLLNQMIVVSRESGVKILLARSFKTNTVMRRLLNVYGFEEVGDLPKIYFSRGQYVNQIVSVLELD